MKKPKTVRWKTRQQQNLEYVSIVAWQSHKRLNQTVRRRQLTESLEILERYGFDSDLGTFMISELQNSLMRRVAR